MRWRDWAEKQIEDSGLLDPDSDYDGMIGRNLLALVGVFASAGHSGMSAQVTRDAFTKLIDREELA